MAAAARFLSFVSLVCLAMGLLASSGATAFARVALAAGTIAALCAVHLALEAGTAAAAITVGDEAKQHGDRIDSRLEELKDAHWELSENEARYRDLAVTNEQASEVIAHLSGLVGAKVKVTLEIEAEVPNGVPEAVVRIVNLKKSRTIAGMWSEGKGANDDTGTRQYALLMNMPTYGGDRQLVPHISAEGGVTMRADGTKFPWCADYAATRIEAPEKQWCMPAFTYDSKYIRAYINGAPDERRLDPVKDKRDAPCFTKEGPGGKDRGMNPCYHGRGIFKYDASAHAMTKIAPSDSTVGARMAVGSMTGEATIGKFGGLAVFNRAPSDVEMKNPHEAADVGAIR